MHHRHVDFLVGQILIHLDVITRRQLDEARLKQMRGESFPASLPKATGHLSYFF